MITEYEVGQIPARPLSIQIKDDFDNTASLLGYSIYGVELLGSNNEKVDLTGVVVNTESARNGRIVVIWPKDRSLFTKRGEYLLRLVFGDAQGSRDYSTPHTIRVSEFGRLNK